MKNFGLFFCGFYFILIDSIEASWGTPESSQYHIQTDEGPERYFKYQTDNGQYRKEKRLEDGTVIGTDAWIDAFGYLRQKDYIADNKGYRILKSKTIFVGTDVPIQVAIKVAKNKPGDDPLTPPPNVFRTQAIGVTSTTPRPIAASTPSVYVRPHSNPVNQLNDNYIPNRRRFYPSTTIRPDILVHSSTYDPILSNDISSTPIVIYPTTPSTIKDESHLPPIAVYNDGQQPDLNTYHKRIIPVESLSNDLLPPRRYDVIPLPSTTARPIIDTTTRNPNYNTQALFNRDLIEPPQNYYRPNFRDRMDTDKYQEYDGVSLTNNGFKYFLPRQYHEEDNSGGSNRVGSYGYIDPFGIRRVTYYNAGPNGFVHRKNNRYVGFNATPYDPRPV